MEEQYERSSPWAVAAGGLVLVMLLALPFVHRHGFNLGRETMARQYATQVEEVISKNQALIKQVEAMKQDLAKAQSLIDNRIGSNAELQEVNGKLNEQIATVSEQLGRCRVELAAAAPIIINKTEIEE